MEVTVTLQVKGPRAQEFVELLSTYSGLPLLLVADTVSVATSAPISPYESATLRKLVFDCIRSDRLVEVNAFGGWPAGIKRQVVDHFHAQPGLRRPRRSVYLKGFEELEKWSPVLAKATMGHILQEYLGAARPAGTQPGRAFDHYHVPAIAAEAQIAADLTGRRIWTSNDATKRPWEKSKDSWEGGLGVGDEIDNVRSFGPDLIFHEIWSGDGKLKKVILPKGL
jgi:hypothetical protein